MPKANHPFDHSEENKENVPPIPPKLNTVIEEDSVSSGSPRPPFMQLYPDPTTFHLNDIIPKFDSTFTTHDEYLTYVRKYLPDWLKDPDFRLFDGAYCQHRLLLTQIKNL